MKKYMKQVSKMGEEEGKEETRQIPSLSTESLH